MFDILRSNFSIMSSCDLCQNAKEPLFLCVRHATCWQKGLFRPSGCDVCLALFSSASAEQESQGRELARKYFRAGSVILTYKIRKFPSPKKIWFSKEERDHFSTSAVSCIDYLLTFRAIFNEEP